MEEDDSLQQKQKQIEDFKGILIKEINKVFDQGMDGDDVVGILEAAKLMAYKKIQDPNTSPTGTQCKERLIGYA